jgi:hypothetical protein
MLTIRTQDDCGDEETKVRRFAEDDAFAHLSADEPAATGSLLMVKILELEATGIHYVEVGLLPVQCAAPVQDPPSGKPTTASGIELLADVASHDHARSHRRTTSLPIGLGIVSLTMPRALVQRSLPAALPPVADISIGFQEC